MGDVPEGELPAAPAVPGEAEHGADDPGHCTEVRLLLMKEIPSVLWCPGHGRVQGSVQGWLLRVFPHNTLCNLHCLSRVDVLAELLDLDRVKRTGVVEQRLGSLEDQVRQN